MKALVKLLSLSVCVVLLCATCKKKEPEFYERPLVNHSLTDYVESSTNSYVQVDDSIYYFHLIRGCYSSYRGRLNKNAFSLYLQSPNFDRPYINISVLTEIIKPESFFQKGIRKIDSMYIEKKYLSLGEGSPRVEYYSTQSLLTWDTVFYENKRFNGKGSLEILDTLYTNYQNTYHHPSTYYPPQKIEFEFKQ